MTIQTRRQDGRLDYYETLQQAYAAAKVDATIWKVSFTVESGERVRLVRAPAPEGVTLFMYEPLPLPMDDAPIEHVIEFYKRMRS